MEKFSKVISGIYGYVLLFFAIAALSVLSMISLVSTCYMTSDINELTFFTKDNVILNIVFLMVFVAVLVVLKAKGVLFDKAVTALADDAKFKRCKRVMYIIITAIGLFWVLSTQFVPGSDQLDVMYSAWRLRNGVTTMLEPGGYLDMWGNQVGLTLIEYLIASVVGDYNIVFVQILNAFGITLVYKKLVDIWAKWGASRLSQVVILICGAIFLPFIMYASFVYGTIWSVALALVSFDAMLRFFEGFKIKDAVICAIAMGFAYQVKNNVLIMFVAMMIYGLLRLIREVRDRKLVIKSVIVLVCVALTFGIFNAAPKLILEKMTGYKLEQGVSSWSFIAMGLQEQGSSPGWSNGYNYNLYFDNGCVTEPCDEIAKENIAETMATYMDNKHAGFQFFSRKLASMWTEPTYQSFWINIIRHHRVAFSPFMENLMSASGYDVIARIFDYLQLLVFFGSILWIILEDKKTIVDKSFLVLCFVGGFMFHMFWEAKSQYSLTYVVLLIPCAVMGIKYLLEQICMILNKCNSSNKENTNKEANNGEKILSSDINKFDSDNAGKIRFNRFALIVFVTVSVLYVEAYTYDSSHCLTNNTDLYNTYVQSWQPVDNTESVIEINILRAEKQSTDELNGYFRLKLDENGISY